MATESVRVKESSLSKDIIDASVLQHRNFSNNREAFKYELFKLLYSNGTEVKNLPHTDQPFVLSDYKEASGKSYGNIKFDITPSGWS